MAATNKQLPWAAEEEARLLADAAAGISMHDTARALGRTYYGCQCRRSLLKRTGKRVAPAPIGRPKTVLAADLPPPVERKRSCLCCGREFNSAGPMNRLCSNCRESANRASPYAP